MPTFEEIGRDYATQVSAALEKDKRQDKLYIKRAYAHQAITPESLPDTELVTTLKKIGRELETKWKVQDKPLTEQQKNEILEEAGKALDFANPEDFIQIAKGASNDAYIQLVDRISALIRPRK